MLTIHKYILLKMLKSSIVILFFMSAFFLTINFRNILFTYSQYGVSYFTALIMALLSLPLLIFQMSSYAFCIGMMIVLNSLYHSSELIVIRTFGVKKKIIYQPLYFFSIIVLIFFIILSIICPWLMKKNFQMQLNIKTNRLISSLKAGEINQNISFGSEKVDIFFRKVDDNGDLHDLTMILKKDDNKMETIYARLVKIGHSIDDFNVIQLYDTDIIVDNNGEIFENKSEIMEISMDLLLQNNKTLLPLRLISRLASNYKLLQSIMHNKYSDNIDMNIKMNQYLNMRIEFYNRIFRFFSSIIFVIFCGLLLLSRKLSRIDSYKKTIAAYSLFGFFVLFESLILNDLILHIEKIYLIFLYIPIIFCIFYKYRRLILH